MKKKIILKNISNQSESIYPQITIAEVQKEFENDLKERGLRPATFSFYNNVLEALYHFVSYKEPICNITKITISNYIKYCRDIRNNSQNTISTNIRGLRTFLYFAMKNNYMPEFNITVPTPDLTPKKTYEIEEIQKLLVKPNIHQCNFSDYVAYVAINVFVFTGCRLSTAINMKVADIDFENNLVMYKHTKNKKTHCVPLAEELKKVLKKYLSVLSEQNIKNEYLLISCYGEQLTSNKLYTYISNYNKKRGVKMTSIHAFRRFYIKSLVIQGVPIPKIQFLVQHKSPELISLYSKIYSKDLIEDVEEFQKNILPSDSDKKHISLKKGGKR
ncbi:tyrosine-type recombinase/integrase [Clostridium guangxiense]|uniref:tyrosine-type recombinase/integrase n=1 Tax=Clostridium guangxiense TaxID=1662055 RepID=UPI001E3E5CF3|nr:site-specific integrase [Clostridium guangxiense]MCD2346249.1 tyrosine-type recombinase/integrase [Clostridium guangxiense]